MINKSAGVRNVFSSVHIERGRGFRCAELIHFGLQHFCLSCCSTPIAHITELDNNVSAHQVLWSSYTFFHLPQKLFEPDGRKRLSFIKVSMNVHWYLVQFPQYRVITVANMTELEGKNSLLGTDLVYKTDQQQLIQGTVRQETCTQENCITVEQKTILALETDS